MNTKESMKIVNNLTGNRKQKAGKGASGYNEKIAELIQSANGTTVSECGKVLFPDYSPALDASASNGKSARKVKRETEAGLARKGLALFRVKISGYDEISIAINPEEVKAKKAEWLSQGASGIKQLFVE